MDYRHNRLRDVIAELLNTCLPKVSTEPPLLQVTAESLPRGTTLEPGARQEFLPEVSTHQCNEHFLCQGFKPRSSYPQCLRDPTDSQQLEAWDPKP